MLTKAVEKTYESRAESIIIGFTGRTGAGCTLASNILAKEKFDLLDLRDTKTCGYDNMEERKQYILHKYLSTDNNWCPFTIIEVSCIILSACLSDGIDGVIDYINKLTVLKNGNGLKIADKEALIAAISNCMGDDFIQAKSLQLTDDISESKIDEYYDFYVNKLKSIKNRIKKIFEAYTCYETIKKDNNTFEENRYNFYIYFMQKVGQNLRSTGSPFDDIFKQERVSCFSDRISCLIQLIMDYDKKHKNGITRICIDAIRNPYEATFLRDKYKSFYLVSISTTDEYRNKRLRTLSLDELENQDMVESAGKINTEELFYRQNIMGCAEIADIHIFNPDSKNGKYYYLTEQLVKYIALMLHPGLVTPTAIERCMQLAYNAKFNSGCLSRQVGAVVTREDYSVQSIGWNDAPKGQVPCSLRDVCTYCRNKDEEYFSEHELTNKDFSNAMYNINSALSHVEENFADKNANHRDPLGGLCFAYCFKDVHIGITGEKNQVHTRALHAEENAFLQISKYGGTRVQDGCLFTTASPCELCAKKAYQLGIKKIFYIDPYPGISKQHILTFGRKSNPQMLMFTGAIGQAYVDLYQQRIPLKDELEMRTGIKVKDSIKKVEENDNYKFNELEYKYSELTLKFENDRLRAILEREVIADINKNDAKEDAKLEHKLKWMGTQLIGYEMMSEDKFSMPRECTEQCRFDANMELLQSESPFKYRITFGRKNNIHYRTKIVVADNQRVMEPFLAHNIKYKTERLVLKLVLPKKQAFLENIRFVIYGGFDRQYEIYKEDLVEFEETDDSIIYKIVIGDGVKYRACVNINYCYSIEWDFI